MIDIDEQHHQWIPRIFFALSIQFVRPMSKGDVVRFVLDHDHARMFLYTFKTPRPRDIQGLTERFSCQTSKEKIDS